MKVKKFPNFFCKTYSEIYFLVMGKSWQSDWKTLKCFLSQFFGSHWNLTFLTTNFHINRLHYVIEKVPQMLKNSEFSKNESRFTSKYLLHVFLGYAPINFKWINLRKSRLNFDFPYLILEHLAFWLIWNSKIA